MHLLFGFITGALAAFNTAGRHVVHEEYGYPPEGWTQRSVATPEEHITLFISIRPQHQNYLDRAREISNPDSPSYARYLSSPELQAALPNLDTSAQRIEQWLSHNLIDAHRIGDKIKISTTVGKASQLLNAEFSWYQHLDSTPVIRTKSYSIPGGLQNDIDFVYPTIHFLTPKQPRSSYESSSLAKRQGVRSEDLNCSNSICPKTIADAYQINYSPPSGSSVRVGIASFLEQYGNHADLTSFLTQFGLQNHSTSYNFTETFINNGINSQEPSEAGVEAMLDLGYVMAFTSTLPITFYSTAASGNEPYLEFLDAILAEEHPPSVISISYADNEETVPLPYANKVCLKFAQLAMRGVSVLVASGDGGAMGSAGKGTCIGPNGRSRGFKPTFPSSCEWVTSVGATQGLRSPANEEPAAFSSGGFSNYFGVPDWQRDAVATYQSKLGDKHKGFYNSSGRGIPDVSAMGERYVIVAKGMKSEQAGTSASTPVVTAVVALLNDLRTRNGMPTLGFLNPLLYGKGRAGWTDVKEGSAVGCSDGDFIEGGYAALEGWDPATGLGTPMFSTLRKLLAT
ncbi:family S53 protease [Pseudovirgaria hyperparasitica]|uniref:tripeptidyl-peptidase II n=1 Tax=Pseudovirgaria hyperparasitica TaxID=470096 RepID=A0A6A6VW18_9PEZI|nr:family S53 protease [Pseudovirgaria hyperparasitica]KAF2754433.1 family S53 protease [Pseudovirgaria hyperparasitica]